MSWIVFDDNNVKPIKKFNYYFAIYNLVRNFANDNIAYADKPGTYRQDDALCQGNGSSYPHGDSCLPLGAGHLLLRRYSWCLSECQSDDLATSEGTQERGFDSGWDRGAQGEVLHQQGELGISSIVVWWVL